MPPPPAWVRGSVYTSSTVLAVNTIAMTVLLIAYPHIGIIGFTSLAAAEGLAFILFSVSFYLLNRKQDERLAQNSFIIRREVEVPPPREGTRRERARDALNSNAMNNPIHVDPDASVQEERHLLSEDEQVESTAEEQLDLEDERPFLLAEEIGYREDLAPISEEGLATHAREAASLTPEECMDKFCTDLPKFFNAAEKVFVSLVSARSRCKRQAPPRSTLNNIRIAFEQLRLLFENIVKDDNQLFSLILGNMAASSCNDPKTLSNFLQENQDPNNFLLAFPGLFSAEEPESFIWVERIYTQAAAGITSSSDRKTFLALYKELQSADKAMSQIENTMNPLVLIKIPNRIITYHTALMNIVNWLYFKTNPEPALIKEVVGNHILAVFDSFSLEEIDLTQLPTSLAEIYENLKSAIEQDRQQPVSIIGKIFTLLNAGRLSPFPTIYSIMSTAIMKSPLQKARAEALNQHLVKTLMPILMELIEESLFSDSSKFSQALERMFKAPPFKLSEEIVPEEINLETRDSNENMSAFIDALNELADAFDKLN